MNQFAKDFALKVVSMNVLTDVRQTEEGYAFIFTELLDVPLRVMIKDNHSAVYTKTLEIMVIVEITEDYVIITKSTDRNKEFEEHYVEELDKTDPDILYLQLRKALMI